MSDVKFNLTVPEGRQELWTALHREEEKNDRAARIGKIQNLPAALIFVFNMLLMLAYLTNHLAKDIPWLTKAPVFGSFIRLMNEQAGNNPLLITLALSVIAIFIPLAAALLIKLAVSPFVKVRPIQVPGLPEREEEQLYTILKKINAITRVTDGYKTPLLMMLMVAAAGSLAGGVIFCIASIQSGASWFAAVMFALLLFVVYVVGYGLLALLFTGIGLVQPLMDEELKKQYDAVNERRNALKGTHRFRKQ